MSGHFFTKLGLIAGGLLLLASQASHAAPITIDNPSFENASGTGDKVATPPSSWIYSTTNLTPATPYTYTTGIGTSALAGKDGNNYLGISLNVAKPPSYQATTDVSCWVSSVSLGTFQANTIYTLTVAQGSETNAAHHFGTIALVADGTLAASTKTPFATLHPGAPVVFNDYSVTLNTTLDPSVVGKAITIQLLRQAEPGAIGYYSAVFDNVRLDATATIPEPATMGLLAIGALMMLPRR